MDGLEIAEINLSGLEFSKRIDSEYYKKKFLSFEIIVQRKIPKQLKDLASFLIGPFGSSYDTGNYVGSSDYRYVRGQDVKPFILKDVQPRFIDKVDYDRLSKYALKQDDILVSVVGTLGNACVVQQKDLPAIFSCKSTVIRTTNVNPYFLISYLNSKYGRDMLLRQERGAIQKGLNLDDLKNLPIPLFSDAFQNLIEAIIKSALEKTEESKALYKQAENILNDELGFNDFTLNNNSTAITNFSQSFGFSGRLDAEFYQAKYDDIEDKLKMYKHGTKSIESVCNLYDANFLPKDNQQYNYVELSDIGAIGNIVDASVDNGMNLPSRARRVIKKGNVIVASVEGSMDRCALVDERYHNAICSTGFYVVDSTQINSETLLLLFKNKFIQLLLRKNCSGTILTALNKLEFLKLQIPLIDIRVQKDIKKIIQDLNSLSLMSDELFEKAKQAVEMAIEQDEETALKWLK